MVNRTVGKPLSRDFSVAGASHAVDRPNAAAGRMSDSKLSPTIQAGWETSPGELSACWNSRGSGLVIPTRPESADDGEVLHHAELLEAALEVAGEIRNDTEVIVLVQPRQQRFVPPHDGTGGGMELIGDGSRRQRRAIGETG